MPQVTIGAISETKYEEEYLGHWRITDKVLMVTLGIYSDAVPIGGMETNPEGLARQVFVGLIDLYLARKRKSRLRLLCDVPLYRGAQLACAPGIKAAKGSRAKILAGRF
jgi:hypothetical protein